MHRQLKTLRRIETVLCTFEKASGWNIIIYIKSILWHSDCKKYRGKGRAFIIFWIMYSINLESLRAACAAFVFAPGMYLKSAIIVTISILFKGIIRVLKLKQMNFFCHFSDSAQSGDSNDMHIYHTRVSIRKKWQFQS